MTRSRLIALAGTLLLTIACAQEDPRAAVVRVSADDARMNAAIVKARTTVEAFEAALRSPKQSQSHFSVNVRISDADGVEHFWTSDVRYDGAVFHARIDNDPEVVKSVKLGQAVTVRPQDISDWMYVDHGVLVGGYTLRVIRDAMTPAERAELDKSLPFKIQ